MFDDDDDDDDFLLAFYSRPKQVYILCGFLDTARQWWKSADFFRSHLYWTPPRSRVTPL